MAITPFNVIQGHRFWYQSKALYAPTHRNKLERVQQSGTLLTLHVIKLLLDMGPSIRGLGRVALHCNLPKTWILCFIR